MQGILAINHFVQASFVLGAIVFKNWFRHSSISILILLIEAAAVAFSYTPLLFQTNQYRDLGSLCVSHNTQINSNK